MDARESVPLAAGAGIEGNANRGGQRQVTLLDAESWAEMEREAGTALDPAARRANILVSGVRLAESRERILELGPCRILIHGETRPCERMDEAHPGLRKLMESSWRGGIYGEVLDDGVISVGDAVTWAS